MDQQITSKEKILKKVRQALTFKSKNQFSNIDLDSNVYARIEADANILEIFAQQLTKTNGEFVHCSNQFDFIDKLITLIEQRKWKHFFCWEHDLQDMLKEIGLPFSHKIENLNQIQASITTCEALIARTGSVLVSSIANSRSLPITAPVHIVMAKKSQLVLDLKEGMLLVKNRYGKHLPSMLNFITGPSKTASINNTMVIGANGTLELFVFVVDDLIRD